jgi:putative nucleotidyltransferase with HDIG domain
LHERSPREKQHSLNVSKLCYNIGQVLELPETELKKLKEAGYFHDIGKIVIEESIINKESRLTDEEEEEMHQHAAIGYRILNLFDDTLNLAEAVYSHHERWDGSGFPKGLKGEEIPLLARIISIAESYERMINGSAIETAMSSSEALQLIREYAGKQYDPQIAELFAHMIEEEAPIEQG